MLIQFHATLAASCNLRYIKDINGIAFFAYFDGTFSQRGIQFLIPIRLQFMLSVYEFMTKEQPLVFGEVTFKCSLVSDLLLISYKNRIVI